MGSLRLPGATLELSERGPLRGYLRVEEAPPPYDLVRVDMEVRGGEVWVSLASPDGESFFVPLEGENPDYRRRLALVTELEGKYGAFIHEHTPCAVFVHEGQECIRCDWRLKARARFPLDEGLKAGVTRLLMDCVSFLREYARLLRKRGREEGASPALASRR